MTTFPHFGTNAVHVGQEPEQWEMNQVVPPLSVSSTYKQHAPGQPKVHGYSRMGNPTRDVMQANLAALENAKYCLTFASGQGAMSAVMSLVKSGDHIIASSDVFGGTQSLLREVAVKCNGVEATFADFMVPGDLEKAFRPNTKMVWFESPSNPLLRVIDIREVVGVVRARNPDVVIVVDNTFMTPYFQRPLSLGVDVVVHSLSKYINGHS
ncbi:hypothetical protein PENTCL1PPCAC_14148, partial [Pristionchus entomophagus]